jgi:4-hydroxybutyryl-CoA dehydratase / vinylacetyl-CoA-Delta-isomerase
MRSAKEYLESLVDGREVYYRGSRVRDITKHPYLSLASAHAAKLYQLQRDPDFEPSPMTVVDGRKISTFYKLCRTPQDLLTRSRLIEETTRAQSGIFNIVQAIGSDAIMALMIVSKAVDAMDPAKGYFQRVSRFHEYVAKNDLALAVGQTDVKGDRMLRPSDQADKDMYLHVVESDPKGIVVRGAKAHTTQAIVSDEVIVLPTRAMTEADKDYAVAFSVPTSTKGLKLVARPLVEAESAQTPEEGMISAKNIEVESLTIFDDVFVPHDRVFLMREWEAAGILANLFGLYHRFTALSYRQVIAETLLGAAKLMAEQNGTEGASHVREKLAHLIMYREQSRMAIRLAALDAVKDERTGIVYPNSLWANIGKLQSNTQFMSSVQNLVDIAGGLISTMPSPEDYAREDIGPLMRKYLAGNAKMSAEERMNLFRLIRELTGAMGGVLGPAMIHAEGSIAASLIALSREYDFGASKAMVRDIMKKGIGGGTARKPRAHG